MEKMRAFRRKKKAIMKKRSVEIYGTPKLADHLAACSGPCCGNARRYYGRPLQELKYDLQEILSDRDYLDEIANL